jgi:hypothetical protein
VTRRGRNERVSERVSHCGVWWVGLLSPPPPFFSLPVRHSMADTDAAAPADQEVVIGECMERVTWAWKGGGCGGGRESFGERNVRRGSGEREGKTNCSFGAALAQCTGDAGGVHLTPRLHGALPTFASWRVRPEDRGAGSAGARGGERGCITKKKTACSVQAQGVGGGGGG